MANMLLKCPCLKYQRAHINVQDSDVVQTRCLQKASSDNMFNCYVEENLFILVLLHPS